MSTTSIKSAVIDGRTRNPRFIQRQLRRLHDALRQNAQALQNAIISDTNVSVWEATLEISLALATVRRQFMNLDVRVMLEDEYRAASGRDWRTRRSPTGLVYIIPQSHTLLYSIVSALSSAIAAGNCVIIEVSLDPVVDRDTKLIPLDR